MSYKQINTENGRFYETPMGIFPSVTTILGVLDKPFLVPWATKKTAEFLYEELKKQININFDDPKIKQLFYESKSQHKVFKDSAAMIGTAVHNLIEQYIKTKQLPKTISDPSIKSSFDGFMKWASKNNFQPLVSEQFVYSKVGYGGTFDCIAMFNGKKYMFDFKTSNSFSETFPLQLSAYAHAYIERRKVDENVEDKIEGGAVLRLDKESGLCEFRDYSDVMDISYKKFYCLCQYVNVSVGG